MIEVNVPATTANLGPGFDVLGLALNLHNTIRMEEWGSGLSFRIFGEGGTELPASEDNAVYKAAERVFEAVEFRPKGLYIETVNRIPLGRGMGSSASAIVGGLVAANELVGAPFSYQELFGMAADIEGHPDNVAAALFGGLTICYRTDSRWRVLPMRPADSLKAVVLVPEEQLATEESRAVLPTEITHADAVFNISRAALLVGAMLNGRAELLAEATKDRLHQPFREPLIPGLDHFTSNVRELLDIGVALSGAGPSIVCLISATQEEDARNRLVEMIDERGMKYGVHVLEIDQCGVRVVRS